MCFPAAVAFSTISSLLGGIDRDIDDFDVADRQKFVNARINFWNAVILCGFFGGFAVPVGDAYDFKSGSLVGGQMSVVDDSAGADDADSAVELARQFRFVVEMRENFGDRCH